MVKVFNKLAYNSLDDFVYGSCPNPVKTKSGLTVGGGQIYPEINFTLPSMEINDSNMPEIRKIYTQIINGILQRAKELYSPGLVVEFETLPPMTENPKWGIEINKILLDAMHEYNTKYGLKSALRITPNDIREMNRPPIMRSGKIWESMLETFEGCAKDGADFLAIESTGGKEIDDTALINADMQKVIFSLGVLGARDMEFLWKHIIDIADRNNVFAAGDSACGFGNTAMVLADRGFIPKVFAAVVRVATVGRALIPFELGAVGPSKDCAYEGQYLKAIAGIPIAMEGKSAACAHLSPIGNIALSAADLWSNESVQQIKLLSAMAPVVSIEQLEYDCRLMNEAKKQGFALKMRDLLADSDSKLDPQAYVLRPDIVFDISKELVKTQDPFIRTKLGAQLAVEKLKKGIENKEVQVAQRELAWLDIMESQIEEIPDDEQKFWHQIKDDLDITKFRPEEYGLK